MSSKRSILSACALVLLLAGTAAHAQQRTLGAVTLALEPELEALALETWRALDIAAPRDPRYVYVDLARRGPDANARGAKAEQASAAAAVAREAYENLDMPRALEKVEQEIQLLEASDLSRTFRQLLDALALQAFLLQARNSPKASEILGRLFTLSPAYRFNASRMNPKFIALAERIRGEVATAPRGSIQVRPSIRAWVFVDGTFRGISPLQVGELPVGPHHVTLLAPGFDLAQETAVIGKKEAVFAPRLTASGPGQELGTRLARLGAGLRQGASAQPASELKAWTEMDELLVVALGRDGQDTRATLLRLSGDAPPLVVRAPAGTDASPEALARAALDLLDRSARETPPPAGEVQKPVANALLSPRLWGYVSVGVGAAAAVGGILIGQDAQRQAREARAIPQTDDEQYRRAAGAARGTALVADGLFVVALAGAGVGTWLLLTRDGTPPPTAAGGAAGQARISIGMTPLREGGAVTLSGGF